MITSQKPFGRVENRDVDLFTLENDNGMAVKITNYGGTVTSLVVPDRQGSRADVVCGFDTLDRYFSKAYTGNAPYFGCIVGRYAGRIKDGRFTVGGRTHQLATNNAPNHLHGGIKGFDKCVWDATLVKDPSDAVLELKLTSPDGDEGYPGTLKVTVEYRLTNSNELRIRYRATTDKATPLALTNHTYFNLNGFKDKILDHVLELAGDRFLTPDDTNVPVGDETAVAGTAADFNRPKRIGDAFKELPMGFEHFYVYRKAPGKLEKVATVTESTSGRTLEVLTTEPGGLLYTGRYTSDDLQREDGTRFGQFRAFCIETARYPNGPNIPGSPGSVLDPGATHDETTVYKFTWS